jgi:hypothetical protein
VSGGGVARATPLGLDFASKSGQRDAPCKQPAHTTERVAFDEIVLGTSADEVSEFWIERRIQRLLGPSRSLDSLSLLRVVANLPGAIGYVRPSQLTGDVHAIRVNGKLPNDASYPLTFSE